MPSSLLTIGGKAAKLGKDALRFHLGGYSAEESRQLGADALDLASSVVGAFAPAPLGPIVADVLTAASSALGGATDLPTFGAALLQGVESALGAHATATGQT